MWMLGCKDVRRRKGSLQFAWWIPQLRDEVLIEVISRATVAKGAKAYNRKGMSGGLRVMSSSQPRATRAQV